MRRIILPAAAALLLTVSLPALAAPDGHDWRVSEQQDRDQHEGRGRGDHGDRGDRGGQPAERYSPPAERGGPQYVAPERGGIRNNAAPRGAGQGNAMPQQNYRVGQDRQLGGQSLDGRRSNDQHRGDWRDNGRGGNAPAYSGPRNQDRSGPSQHFDDRRYNDQRFNDQRFNDWQRGDQRGYDRSFQDHGGYGDRDRRDFDGNRWQRNYYSEHRYHWRPYVRPYGWYDFRWTYGMYLPGLFWNDQEYWISDYWDFGLPPPPYGYVWVRNGDDALLIDEASGYILQVVYGVFY